MIEAILQHFGMPQNAERLKTELGREVNGQLTYVTGAIRVGLRASVFYAIATLTGIITVVAIALLFYSWLDLYLGPLGSMAVTAGAFGLMTIIAIYLAQSRIVKMPAYQSFRVPQLYKKIERPEPTQPQHARPVQSAAGYANPRSSAETSIGAEDETRQWLLGLFKQGYSRNLNTGVNALDSFIANMRPDAELMARQGLQTVEEKLRSGSRPTLAAILLAGLVTGFLFSSRVDVKH